MKTAFAATLLGLSICLSAWGGGPAKSGSKKDAGSDHDELVKGNNEFALDLYARLGKKEGNVFFSPYSISNALAMTYAGARGETAEQMAKTLHFSLGQERLHPAFGGLIRELQGEKDKPREFELYVANALWGQQGYPFLPRFLNLLETEYQSPLRQVDFAGDTAGARKIINDWVEAQTKKKIRDFVREENLSKDTRFVLANALYFKAAWVLPFEKENTTNADFFLAPDSKKSLPMMRQEDLLDYYEGEAFQLLQLRYQGAKSFVALLPKRIDGLSLIEKDLTNVKLMDWLGKLQAKNVSVWLPRFGQKTRCCLTSDLRELGMPLAFSNGADFSGMLAREELRLGEVIHEAVIEVNEKGTEASAATAVVGETPLVLPAASTPISFRADHPFLFLIRDNHTGSILFLGRVMNP